VLALLEVAGRPDQGLVSSFTVITGLRAMRTPYPEVPGKKNRGLRSFSFDGVA